MVSSVVDSGRIQNKPARATTCVRTVDEFGMINFRRSLLTPIDLCVVPDKLLPTEVRLYLLLGSSRLGAQERAAWSVCHRSHDGNRKRHDWIRGNAIHVDLDDDDDEDTRSTHEQLAEFLDQSIRK